MQKIFGTDGVRGVFGEEITPKLAFDIGRALALYIKDEDKNILIAKDTRISGDILLTAVISGITSAGVGVVYMGITTTPALAFLTKNFGYGCGIMITASHNSYEYNGIKIFKSNGEKLGPKEEISLTKIYKALNCFDITQKSKCGSLKVNYGINNKYINFLKSILPSDIDKKIAFDCANGTTYNILSKLFKDSKNICLINTLQNGKKVNENCGATDTRSLAKFVVKNDCDYGFAFDGDGDRVVMVDSLGTLHDGDDILYNLALNLKKNNKLKKSTIVGTIMTNKGIENALNKEGINLIRVDVGDKYIVDKLSSDNLSLGGESAGHIIAYDYTNTGDGVLTSLIMLEVINALGLKKVKATPQKIVNIACLKVAKIELFKNKNFAEYIERIKSENPDFYIVVRPSGTENKIRIMVDGESEEVVEKLIDDITSKIKQLV